MLACAWIPIATTLFRDAIVVALFLWRCKTILDGIEDLTKKL